MNEKSSISDWIKSLYQYDVLTIEQERELYHKIKTGDWRAEEKLLTHNLRFVLNQVKRTPFWAINAIPKEDLIQAGNMGLLEAVRKWVPQGNIRFVSFAKTFIKRYVQRAVEKQQNIIKVPVRVLERTRKMLWIEGRLMQQLNRNPTREELAEALKIKPSEIDRLREIIRREPCSLDSILAASQKLEEETD